MSKEGIKTKAIPNYLAETVLMRLLDLSQIDIMSGDGWGLPSLPFDPPEPSCLPNRPPLTSGRSISEQPAMSVVPTIDQHPRLCPLSSG